MDELVRFIAQSLVDNKEAVKVESRRGDRVTIIELRVSPEDMGKVIGRQGRIARAIRAVVKAASLKDGGKYSLEIL